MLKIWSKQLLYGKSGPTPYLDPYIMASKRAILGCGLDNRLVYTQNAQILQDTITGAEDLSKFVVSMDIDSSVLRESPILLIKLSGLLEIWTAENTIMFRMPKVSNNFLQIPSNVMQQGFNSVSVVADDGIKIYALINDARFTILDSSIHYDILDYAVQGSPTITVDNVYWKKVTGFQNNNNFIKAVNFPNLATANSWRIGVRFKDTSSNTSGYGPICGGSARYIYPAIGIQYSDMQIYAQFSSNGSSWDIVSGGFYPGIYFQSNEIYDVVLQYESKKYNIGIKTPDQSTYTFGTAFESDLKVFGNPLTTGDFRYGCMWGDRSFGGEIYTEGCFIEADGVYYSQHTYIPHPYPEFDTVENTTILQSADKIKNIYLTKVD